MTHYYPEDQSSKNVQKIKNQNVCAVCGRQVSLYYDMVTKTVYIACSGQVHEGITREYKTPAEDYQSNIRRSMELEEKVGQQAASTAVAIPKQGQLTQPQAMHILKLVYPKAPEDEIIRCAILCRDFGLHPLMKEVYLICFNEGKQNESWATVIGIQATRKMTSNRKGAYSYLDDSPRNAIHEEIVKQYGEDSEEEKDNLISICKLQGEKGNIVTAFGLWPKNKIPYGTDKGNTKRNMANIRSERRASDMLPGEALPQGVEIVDESYVDVPNIGKVSGVTGEIEEESAPVDGIFEEVPPEAEEGVDGTEEEVEKEKQKRKSLIDIDWLKESVKTLVERGETAYSDESLLGYMRLSYKEVAGDTIYEIAANLGKGSAIHFDKVIRDALAKP